MTVEVPQRTTIDPPVPSSAVATRTEELIIKEARRRHRRRLLAIAGTITMLIAGVGIAVVNSVGHGSSATQPSPLSTRPRQPPPIPGTRCQNGQLSVTLLSAGAGAGQRDEVFGFSNVSKTSCTVTGYPVVVALDAKGAESAAAEPLLEGIGGVHTGATAPPTFTLKPGQSASATIAGDNNPVGTANSCPFYPSFLVTPPDQTQSVEVPARNGNGPGPFPGCVPITVNPVVPGTSGALPAVLPDVRTPIRSADSKPSATMPPRGNSVPATTTP
jgi:Protein of unknown function (DUF4232)